MNGNCLQGILLFVSTHPTYLHCFIVVYNSYCLLEVTPVPDNGLLNSWTYKRTVVQLYIGQVCFRCATSLVASVLVV